MTTHNPNITIRMSLTGSVSHRHEQHHTSGNITAIPHRIHKYIHLRSALTHRQSKPVVSRNPLQRLLQSEFSSTPRKVRVMSLQQGDIHSPIPTAASRWKKETLDLLNANYVTTIITDFKFEGLGIPQELQISMTRLLDDAYYSH